MRPIYHQTDKRIAAHIWISVLSYYAVHSLRLQLKRKGINNSWDSLRKISYRVRLTTLYPNNKEEMVGYRRLAKGEGSLLASLGRLLDGR